MMKTKSESLSIQRAKPMIEQKNKKLLLLLLQLHLELPLTATPPLLIQPTEPKV